MKPAFKPLQTKPDPQTIEELSHIISTNKTRKMIT